MDIDGDDDDGGAEEEVAAAAVAALPPPDGVAQLPSWVDKTREYPTLLPFRAPATRAGPAATSPLAELGLASAEPDSRLLLVQLPVRLRSRARGVALTARAQSLLPVSATPGSGCSPLEALPDGRLGSLLVYASGAVKLRVGDVLFDVLPGAPLAHCEQVAAINCALGRAAILGTAQGRVVLTPDLPSLLCGAAAAA